MGEKVTKARFLRIIDENAPIFSELGFAQTEPAVFFRQRGEVEQGFFLTPNPSYTHFTVEVGANVPAVAGRIDFVDFGHGRGCTSLLVSRPLGLLRSDMQGERTFYHFATVEQMREKMPQVYADFLEQAGPWLARLTTTEEVAREFFKWRLAPPSTGDTRRPDPFAWAIYGWLLQEAGHKEDARSWLVRAYDFLQQPEHMKAGRLVPRGTPGSRPIPRRAEDERLMHLIKKYFEARDNLGSVREW